MISKLPVWNRNKSLKIVVRIGIAVLGLASVVSLPKTYGCGNLSLPTTHFEGVSESGYVSHWDQIGSLDLGDVQVPLIMGFQTYLSYSSPELGAGWVLPLMDTNIIQRDANNFMMLQPDGWLSPYLRDGNNPNILHGPAGAIAEIDNDTITVSYSCSASWKMVFTNGKLTSLSKGDHVLNIIRDAQGRGVAVKDGPKIVMTLEQDQKTGLAKSIAMEDAKYQLSYDAKPRIETVRGVNLVGGVDQSLYQIIHPNGKSQTFDFAVTQKLLPKLTISDTKGQERTIVWDTSNRITKDGEWIYHINPSSSPDGGNASIIRTNQQQQSESWFRDDANGRETSISLDGTKTEKTWFNSGLLNGKIRCITTSGQNTDKTKFIYDEKGRLKSITKNDIIIYKKMEL